MISVQTGIPIHRYVTGLLETTDFIPAINAHTPGLLDEVRGIAEGSGLSFEVVYAYQLVDEEWWYRRDVTHSTCMPEMCSSIGVQPGPDSPTIVAQNMDLPDHYDGSQILLHMQPEGQVEVLAFAPAGLIATTGLNRAGVAVCCNSLPQLRHDKTGLPVAFVLRGILARRSLADAVKFVRSVPHATAQNYVLGGPDGAADYEVSPRAVTEVMPKQGRVVHTNHPLVNDDLDSEVPPTLANQDTPGRTLARLRRLEELMVDNTVTGVEQVMMALSDCTVPTCVRRGREPGGMTLGSLVMQLADEPVLYIAGGPPADVGYSRVSFEFGIA